MHAQAVVATELNAVATTSRPGLHYAREPARSRGRPGRPGPDPGGRGPGDRADVACAGRESRRGERGPGAGSWRAARAGRQRVRSAGTAGRGRGAQVPGSGTGRICAPEPERAVPDDRPARTAWPGPALPVRAGPAGDLRLPDRG